MRIKNILTLFILGLFFQEIKAQVDDESVYEFGLRIAPQISWISPDSKTIKDGGSSLDWNYGLHIAKKFTRRYAIAMEVNVINMVSKVKMADSLIVASNKIAGGSAIATDMAINYNLRYLQVPILFKMTTDPFKNKWRAYGEFGLGFSFLLRSKADVTSKVLNLSDVDVDNPENGDEFKLKDKSTGIDNSIRINFLRPSFIIGGGVTYDLFGNTKAFAGLRYDGGLFDYMDADKWTANNSFTALNIGIIF